MSDYTSEFFARLRKALEDVREECRRRGWADYIYTPYVPLVITQVFDERKEERDRLPSDQG